MKLLVRHLLFAAPVVAALTAALLIAWAGTPGTIGASAEPHAAQMSIPF